MGPSGKGSAKQTLPINLPTSMIAWLRASTTSYDLSNESKAVRCCVNCVALGDVKFIANADFFDKNDDCQRTMDIELAMEQLEWIDTNTCSTTTATTTTTTTTNFKNRNDVIRGVIAACMQANDNAVVFGVIRCKSKVASCDGAKDAIAKLVSNRRSNNSESNNANTSSNSNNNNTAY